MVERSEAPVAFPVAPPVAPVAFVTGASQGIGAATAVALACGGFDMVISARDRGTLSETVGRIEAAGRRALPVSLEIRDQDSIERAYRAALDTFGALDVLVNNASLPSLRKGAIEVARDEWSHLVEVNLTGTFFMAQGMGRYLIGARRAGVIVNMASTHGLVGFPGASAYGVTKAAVIHMTRVLAVEWAEFGIRVNAIAPGRTVTSSREAMFNPEHERRARARIPLGRSGRVEEMAAAVAYLVRPEASYITGQTLVLDGGVTVV
ncbi:SDR family NAD(P)-dependent oxidoreductase [Pseudochelatococcus sp. B33]